MRGYRKRIDVGATAFRKPASCRTGPKGSGVGRPSPVPQRAVRRSNRGRRRVPAEARFSSLKHLFKRAAGAGPYTDFSGL